MLSHFSSSPILPKRVIVLGSEGFIGRKLYSYLKKKGINILGISRKECDLLNAESINFLKSTFQIEDQVVFLSAITPDRGRGIETFIKNLRILENVSLALQASPVKQFVLFSSEAIYPQTSNLIKEATSLAPSDLYGCMHLAREIHLGSFNLSLLILRLTVVYGEGDTHNSYGPNRFLREALSKQTITLFGDGEEKRSHIFVEDVIKFIEKTLIYQSKGVINLCPGPSVSFRDIAETIRASLGNDIKILSQPRASEITHRYFDNTALYQSFPDFSFTNIEEGLEKMIEDLKR